MFRSPRPRLRFALPLLLTLLGFSLTQAQNCACNGSIQPSADENCEIVLTAADILSDFNNNPCPGPYTFELFVANPDGSAGFSLGTSQNSLTITADRIPGTYMVGITPGPGSTSGGCMTTVIAEDKLAPAITNCADITLVCNDLVGLAAVIQPVISDNCSANADLDIDISGTEDGPGCFAGNVRARLLQFVSVTDEAGNTSTCLRTVSFTGIPFADIEFAPDVTVDCADDASVLALGLPMFGGQPIGTNDFCGVVLDTLVIFDSGANTCPRTIARQITIVDNCQAPGFVRDTFTVVIDDTTPPVITCPPTLTIGNVPGQCFGSLPALPTPVVSDDCDTDVTVTTTMSFADLSQIPLGNQTITYKATDACGNTATCSVNLLVTDTEGPTLICDQITQVSLNNQGVAVVNAAVFDDGSFDNCGTPLAFTVRRDGVPFGPTVTFTCADVGQTIMVFMRATEIGGGGLSDVCMVEVLVDDKIAPQLICPPNLTIECTDATSNLAVFGTPTVFEGCAFTLAVDSTSTVGNCGTGLITRTFTATDASGNVGSCTQTITVINSTPFTGAGIVFPSDVTIENACISDLSALAPGNLPVGAMTPVLPNTPCTMLGTSFEDQVFDVNGPACFKIVRTWSVLDWCVFDAQNPAAGGLFTDQQIIKVIDTNAPTLSGLPDTLEVDIDDNCAFGNATLVAQAADDCALSLDITNDGPFAAGGADASGAYPAGVTPVTFTADDGCGNQTSETVIVNVVDNKPPTPQCIPDVVTPLANMVIDGDTMILAMVDAAVFDAGSFDNCPGPLEFFIRPSDATLTDTVPTTTQLTYDCSDFGTQLVDFFVVDAAGNFDFCTVSIILQAPNQICGPVSGDPQIVTLGGQVACPDGTTVPGVTVTLTDMNLTAQTNTTGEYAFGNVATGHDYTLTPHKTDELLAGVSTYDLVLISKHILGVVPFTTPAQYLAADVNHSESVSTLDIVALRKAILYLSDHFPNNESYRFVPTDHVFPSGTDPWSAPIPAYALTGMLYGNAQVDFSAIKVGDVSGATGLRGLAITGRNDAPAALEIQDAELQAGTTYILRVGLRTATTLDGLQAALRGEGLEFKALQSDYLTVDEYVLDEEQVRFSWLAEDTGTGADFLVLEVRATHDGRLSDMLALDSRYAAEAYDPTGILPLILRFTAPQPGAGIAMSARPNPFGAATRIQFSVPTAGSVAFRVTDVAGRTVYRSRAYYAAGTHELRLRESGLPQGLLFLQLQTATESATLKLVHE